MKGKSIRFFVAGTLALGLIGSLTACALSEGIGSVITGNENEDESASPELKYNIHSEVVAGDITVKAPNTDIVFGGVEAGSGAWLTNEERTENLTATFEITVPETVGDIGILFDTGTDWGSNPNGFIKAVAHGLIAMPTYAVYDAKTGMGSEFYTLDLDYNEIDTFTLRRTDAPLPKGGVKLQLEVQFHWGAHFGYENPVIYYNRYDYDENISGGFTSYDSARGILYGDEMGECKVQEDAINSLTALYEWTKDLEYEFLFREE